MHVAPFHLPLDHPVSSSADLRSVVSGSGRWTPEWVALDAGTVVAAAGTLRRPDDRHFLRVVGDLAALEAITRAAHLELGRPLHLGVGADDAVRLAAAHRAGYRTVLEVEGFLVRFDDALRAVPPASVPAGVAIVPVTEVDERAAFDLDNELRNDVPGTDGWRGNRAWFHEEISDDPAFDPSGYLVALDRAGRPQGLIRFWRNPECPRLGLVGVRRPRRRSRLAGVLLRRGLEAASQWGSEVFATETSLTNRAVHPRLSRLAVERTGLSTTLVYEPVR